MSRTVAAFAPEDGGGGGEESEAPEPRAEASRRHVQAVGACNRRRDCVFNGCLCVTGESTTVTSSKEPTTTQF